MHSQANIQLQINTHATSSQQLDIYVDDVVLNCRHIFYAPISDFINRLSSQKKNAEDNFELCPADVLTLLTLLLYQDNYSPSFRILFREWAPAVKLLAGVTEEFESARFIDASVLNSVCSVPAPYAKDLVNLFLNYDGNFSDEQIRFVCKNPDYIKRLKLIYDCALGRQKDKLSSPVLFIRPDILNQIGKLLDSAGFLALNLLDSSPANNFAFIAWHLWLSANPAMMNERDGAFYQEVSSLFSRTIVWPKSSDRMLEEVNEVSGDKDAAYEALLNSDLFHDGQFEDLIDRVPAKFSLPLVTLFVNYSQILPQLKAHSKLFIAHPELIEPLRRLLDEASYRPEACFYPTRADLLIHINTKERIESALSLAVRHSQLADYAYVLRWLDNSGIPDENNISVAYFFAADLRRTLEPLEFTWGSSCSQQIFNLAYKHVKRLADKNTGRSMYRLFDEVSSPPPAADLAQIAAPQPQRPSLV